jgi:riboflavin kinase/FMN adenylyltransferase
MRIFRAISEAGALRGCAVAIGNFDGVHLGHRRLFELARELAAPRGAPAVALTFDPHPVRVLRPQLAPPLLTPLARKLELFEACGLDAAVVQPFDLAYARSDAAEFVSRDLAGHLGAADVVVGHDFTAGRGRTRVDGLRALLAAVGARLTVIDPVASEGLVVSSTKIRELLLEGQVEGAAQLLGRPHDVDGVVERGAGRGRGIGFATANLRPEAMLPANGVYAVRAQLFGRASAGPAGGGWPGASGEPREAGADRSDLRGPRLEGGPLVYDAACNVGVKPTVEEGAPVTAEVHLLDFPGRDLYGERVRVAFLARLRDERRFPSLEALKVQIAADVARTRGVLATDRGM